MKGGIFFLMVIAALLVGNQVVDGCSCMPTHPQDQFCNSDFVIVARIMREVNRTSHKKYKIKIKKAFKMSDNASTALKDRRLTTSINEAMCGVSLNRGKTYAISGHIRNMKAYINLCDYVKPWSEVPRRQRKGLKRLYHKSCNCKVKFCPYGNCTSKQKFCMMTNLKCHMAHGICQKSISGQCRWTKSKVLEECLEPRMVPPVPPDAV